MPSIVLELQHYSLRPDIGTADLLRRANVVAKKLKVTSFAEWISLELNGYGHTRVPQYRVVHGTLRAWNPYRGWIPVVMDNPADYRRLATRECSQPIGIIESLYDTSKDGGLLQMPFSPETENALAQASESELRATCHLDRSSLAGIIDCVKTAVLNWSLQLEADGILGENLTFTVDEQRIAGTASYNVNNFFGTVSDAQIQQGTATSSQRQG